MKVEREFPNNAAFVNHARRFVSDAIGAVPATFLFDVQLMTSELVSNALLHAESDSVVSVELHDRLITVAVTDRGKGKPDRRDVDPRQLSGRGLNIVAALARDWGIREAVPPPGKTVWFTVEVPKATTPRSRAERKPTRSDEPHNAPRAQAGAPHGKATDASPRASSHRGSGSSPKTDARLGSGTARCGHLERGWRAGLAKSSVARAQHRRLAARELGRPSGLRE